MYSITVSNLGNVWQGANPVKAAQEFKEWKEQAEADHGRASGETVTLFKDGEPSKEFHPDTGYYRVEFTDTFGGEANYCWVSRYRVKASSELGAIRKASKAMGYSGSMRGDGMRYNVRGSAVCAFVEHWEHAYHSQEKYETI